MGFNLAFKGLTGGEKENLKEYYLINYNKANA
jgi:hypothetical protein